jgi:hypothetical protein
MPLLLPPAEPGAVATAAAVSVAGGGNERAGVSDGVTRASRAAVTTAAAAG